VRRAGLVVVLVAALGAGLAGCGSSTSSPGEGAGPAALRHDPVVFVHGYGGRPADWAALRRVFLAAGWSPRELVTFGYDSRGSNRVAGARLARAVAAVRARTGAARVDLVTFSMGALPSRVYLKELGGTADVDRWVSLGGPNHGAAFAARCRSVACREMRFGSPLLQDLSAGDPTPGPTVYATWWSPCDTTIDPDASVALPGARSIRTRCLEHGALLGAPDVAAQVVAFVRPRGSAAAR
jgi:triacylglycerol lipase